MMQTQKEEALTITTMRQFKNSRWFKKEIELWMTQQTKNGQVQSIISSIDATLSKRKSTYTNLQQTLTLHESTMQDKKERPSTHHGLESNHPSSTSSGNPHSRQMKEPPHQGVQDNQQMTNPCSKPSPNIEVSITLQSIQTLASLIEWEEQPNTGVRHPTNNSGA